MKSFTYSGVWWLPSREDHKVIGKVTFTEEDETKLKLNGMLQDISERGSLAVFTKYPIILGLTKTDQPVTLLVCYVSQSSLKGNGRGAEECRARITFIGTHFTEPEHIVFKKIDIQYSCLPEWAALLPYYGYQKHFNEVRASIPKGTVTVQIIEHIWNELTRESDLIGETDLPEVVRIRCEMQEALSLNEWMIQFITPLQNLISLATQQPNAIIKIVGYIEQSEVYQPNSNAVEVPVEIAFSPPIIPITPNKNSFRETILFTVQEVALNFSSFIDAWIRTSAELKSAYRLFFGVQYTNLTPDLRFLLIAQAVEVYQDHRFNETSLPEVEYQELMELLLSACPGEKKEWLKKALKHSNQASFRQQLRNIISQTNNILQPLLGNSETRKVLAEVIFETRNYLTHHTEILASKSADGIELYYITRCLSLALQVCLMKELGFTTDQLKKIVQKHEYYGLILSLQPRINLKKLVSHS